MDFITVKFKPDICNRSLKISRTILRQMLFWLKFLFSTGGKNNSL